VSYVLNGGNAGVGRRIRFQRNMEIYSMPEEGRESSDECQCGMNQSFIAGQRDMQT
jgi:hypothetical protein